MPIEQWGARGSEELTHKTTATVADALQGTFLRFYRSRGWVKTAHGTRQEKTHTHIS